MYVTSPVVTPFPGGINLKTNLRNRLLDINHI